MSEPNSCYLLFNFCVKYSECLRNWRFEASNDNIVWFTLKEHVDDPGLDGVGSTFTWKLDTISEPYQHFRVFMTGKNSNSGCVEHHLFLIYFYSSFL
jgi:hypothetical protein